MGRLNQAHTDSFRHTSFAVCPICNKFVDLLAYDQAAELFHTDLQDIEFLANNSSIHRVHNRKGVVMICSISLFECFDNRRTRLLDTHFSERLGLGGDEEHGVRRAGINDQPA